MMGLFTVQKVDYIQSMYNLPQLNIYKYANIDTRRYEKVLVSYHEV